MAFKSTGHAVDFHRGMITFHHGWGEVKAMNARACCEAGDRLTYCEDLCFFIPKEKDEADESSAPFWTLPEGFSGP
jgi:hypothetical protein